MKIVYSPFYSNGYYIDLKKRKDCLLGLKVCGSNELLSELELRSGIVSQELSEPERLIDFHGALSGNISDTIFERSFKRDEVGVSRQLMAWCDSLLIEGWTPDANHCSDKLKDLAKLVKGVKSKHISARWKELAKHLENHRIFQEYDSIEVHDTEQIPAVVRNTLDVLEKQMTVNYIVREGSLPETFSLYQFKTRSDAYQWYLSKPKALQDVDVTISSDNCILNDMAIAMGQPVVNSTATKSNPQLLQLFKLGMSLFIRPVNVYNLLSYLQIPGNPLGGVSYKLARVLSDEGGVNKTWEDIIEEYDFTDDEGKDKRAEKLAFIEMLNKDYLFDKILVEDVKSFANKLARWCDQLLRVDGVEDERKEQLVVLASFCRSLHEILPADGYITSETLKAHVDGIYQPQSFTHMRAQKDSPDTVSSISQLADDVNKVCWLGCVGGDFPAYPFDFLNTSELASFEESGILIPSKSTFYAQHHNLELDGLKHVKELILVTWEYDSNARQEEHPLITELKHRYKDKWETRVIVDAVPNLEEETGQITVLEPHGNYQLSKELKEIRREKESYTSIGTLIQHPFDYTMVHLLKLREPQVGQLPDLDTTKGLVAHLFVEKLFETFGGNMADEYMKMDQDDIKKMMGEAIQQKGAILLLPEYKLERQQFEGILQKSVTVLAGIIQNLGLEPIGSEVEINVDLDTIGAFYGSVDMVLKDSNGNLVIFDFKWSESKGFRKKLEENKSIQLELYRKAAQKHYGSQIVGVAYYLFPMMTMFTSDFSESRHIRRVKVKTEAASNDLFEEIQNSYRYRRDELDHGFIEDGEMEEIAELGYTKAGNDTPFYPLDNEKGIKSCPYVKEDKPPFVKKKATWNMQTNNPKEKKTTHPILKGRLL